MSKTTVLSTFTGFVVGIVLLGSVSWAMMPGMMLQEAVSPYGLQETVDKISENAKAAGWKVPSKWKVNFQKNLKKVTGTDIQQISTNVFSCFSQHKRRHEP